jgi:hypothetical protein
MSKDIHDLVPDIYELLRGTDKVTSSTVVEIDDSYKRQVHSWEREAPSPTDPIYASEYGDKCTRKLWYKRNKPETGEPLEPWVKFKFMFGDSIEALLLGLAHDAGHEVDCEQERVALEIGGEEALSGRMDAVIDGHVVDVKSMSTYAFNVLKNNNFVLTEENDKFGYRWQVAFYHHKLAEEGVLLDPDAPAFILAADKQLGHIALVEIEDLPSAEEVAKRAARGMAAVRNTKVIPPRGYSDVPDGASGNRKLDIACSYCAFKHECWPGLRTFYYSRGPVYLTEVAKEPKVPEAV